MKKALISTFEPRDSGYRVAQIVNTGEEFPVADGLYWIDCDDNIEADIYWLDPVDNSFKIYNFPKQPQIKPIATEPQPVSTGTTTL